MNAAILRRAKAEDAAEVARIHRASLFDAVPHLPRLHTPEDDLAYFTGEIAEAEVWVATRHDLILGFGAWKDGWIRHLYLDPAHQGQGIGKALLGKMRRPPEARLWCFQANARARGFYEHLGFAVARMTDGRDNEEREPDILYLWQAEPAP